ncbi:bestrophin family protein [uncultured Hymenobacter sp.]|uniref:bestrophin family protein n=1 Tax=uncultured Hymenobacter sp. TaxID=170016 RepID=UPI0035CAC8EE
MYVRNNIRFKVWWSYSWWPLLVCFLYDSFICLLYGYFGVRALDLPWAPVATLGTAVAFYIGFKNNGSYDRFSEGRQLWGVITNLSRLWAISISDYVQPAPDEVIPDPAEVRELHRRLLYRQLAWVNALRLHLRRQTAERWDAEVAPFLSLADSAAARDRNNPPTHLLRQQSEELRHLHQRGLLAVWRQVSLVDTLRDLFHAQGGCERIKNTPFPRQYAYFSYVFVRVFAAVLPLGLVEEFDKMGPNHVWLTVPVAMLVAWVFNTIEVVGHTSENPFDNTINDVPMSSICRTIEIDLRELLGEKELPTKLEAVNDVLY